MQTDQRPSSSISDMFSEDSLRDKSLLKRSISKQHNSNFKAGYVPVNEQYLKKTGLRGRKTFAFWTLVTLLFLLAVGNLILTITILGVLKLGQGMESMELVPEQSAIKFYGDADLGHLYKRDGKIEGFRNEPMEISAEESAILINLSRNGRAVNKLRLNDNGTTLWGFETFQIKNSEGNTVFQTSTPHFHQIRHINSLKTESVATNRIVSPIGNDLKIEGTNLHFKGSEGTVMDSKEIVWSADQDIYLKAMNGSIVLSGKEGTFLDVKKIPIATLKHTNYISAQYKVCVCMPQGKLFRIPVPSGYNSRVYCDHINMSPQHNPCI